MGHRDRNPSLKCLAPDPSGNFHSASSVDAFTLLSGSSIKANATVAWDIVPRGHRSVVMANATAARKARLTVLFAHPSAELYGSDRVLLESVSSLTDAGHRVVVTLPVHGPLETHIAERGGVSVVCPTPVLRKSALQLRGFVTLLVSTISGILRGWRLIGRLRPDLIYVNTVTVPLWVVLARLAGVPVLAHVHEGEASASAFVKRSLALPLLLADRVIANSRFSVGVLKSSFLRLAATEVIYNGVLGPQVASPARENLDGDLRVTYLGRISPRKGVDVALEAVAILNSRGIPATLDLVGAVFAGYEWYEEDLKTLAALRGLTERVNFSGFREQVWQSIEEADVMVVPSRIDEPFGNTAVEAILGGRPVIASATSGLLEATAGYQGATTVTPGDPVELADALEAVRDGWQGVRDRADHDLQLANRRHAPSVYRERIASVVWEMTR